MKLIINEKQILENIQQAELLVGSASVALVFKDFYKFLYNTKLNKYVVFSNNIKATKQVSYNITNKEMCFGKVLANEQEIARFLPRCKRVYIPLNFYDNREGLSLNNFLRITDQYSEYRSRIWLLITSGCSSAKAPTNKDLLMLYETVKNNIAGVSIGGSFYLQNEIPSFVNEVRIGEYFIFGTIPYVENKENFQKSAIIFETEVLETYPERNQILVNGGYATLNTQESKLLSKGLYFSSISSDYTVFNHYENEYKKGDVIRLIPSYKSLTTLQHINCEYT